MQRMQFSFSLLHSIHLFRHLHDSFDAPYTHYAVVKVLVECFRIRASDFSLAGRLTGPGCLLSFDKKHSALVKLM